MLSTHSFNALLKTLEEPPAHVKFLLATTDPQKLPITIISRCLQFVLRPLPHAALAEYLGTILHKEQISYEPDALWQLSIVPKAPCAMRCHLLIKPLRLAMAMSQMK